MRPTKCLANEKYDAREAKTEGGEKAKNKSQDCCVTLEILLSAHARTSQAGSEGGREVYDL